ncbi:MULTISPECIES: molybdopterin molybdotransferase MoeA [unclassified Pseudomonas]|uniref:molybdopterin molybdotransferase MoeA n=1 Tax=unclassified Pseudomonas TaxID=196821 RepID=UPI000C86B81A|nr:MULTISPECIES: gephyrin-like molybdotransferase Glp [unclassified Pseudomonas]PMV18001.1 molybdopterin molybdenumtransferase MoeA [Pseudomonas sp. FW305-3-2-15-C-TSA2]PMV19751.1 molybdopterin molybdenumtransferase MoeA [Pseudomonas sp. DP16D-L5]PMV36503.1 molybdopterin molybdenumtransferase MoeA [Pseudomonas sp. FW305-3-2-15-A-LB2]PMV49010.1 molybdopterin molybdenumtransferase MoeA [Pseudomonas sp. FW305-3-2-15-C-R2A1]PMV53374.1 molybdopterin molybdenumtransferase MoeA [Pseudomonas sp. FW305
MSTCDSGDLLPVEEAIEQLLAQAPPPPATEMLALAQALGRVTAEEVFSPRDLPGWDNSAMDGYALRAFDVPEQGGYLEVVGRIAAGHSTDVPLQPWQAVRIFTGAPLPPGADSVVPQERCRVYGQRIWCPPLRLGEHVRKRGEELQRGQRVLSTGKRLRAQELGLLAAAGIPRVKVYRPLRVCLLSSGDELREPGESLAPGQIYNSNRYLVAALLRGWGVEVHDYGVMADALAASRDALMLASSECDLLLTTGGVSVGEEDHLKQAIQALGKVEFWRLAIQPGKPLAFGQVAGKPWIGLPGNPTAALVTTLIVVRPFLLRAQGVERVLPVPVSVPAAFEWLKPNKRRQYLRARLSPDSDGQLRAILHPQQSSAMLAAACWADGLVIVEREQQVLKGAAVPFLSFADFQ